MRLLPLVARMLKHWPGAVVACFVWLAIYNTIFNNAYQYGATFNDSTIFATNIWHAGWGLTLAPPFGRNFSFFITHASPILYIPDALSYLFPGNFMTYYALVYGFVYAALAFIVYYLIAELAPSFWDRIVAALGSFAFFCSRIIYEGAWEMHMEIMYVPLCILAFRAWQLQRYKTAIIWFTLTAMAREDIGLINAIPLAMLVAAQYRQWRPVNPPLAEETLRWGMALVGLCVFWTVLLKVVPPYFVHVGDMINGLYFNKQHPFEHLKPGMLTERIGYIFHHQKGAWMPLVILAIASILFHDVRLLVGAIGFMPLLVAMFFSKMTMAAHWDSYKAFVLAPAMLWPALMALNKPLFMRRSYLILQCVVLIFGVCYIADGPYYNGHYRWRLQPLAQNTIAYKDFEKTFDEQSIGKTVVSQGILALYPFHFHHWIPSSLSHYVGVEARTITTIIWFQDDRDQRYVNNLLAMNKFYIIKIADTKIRVAHRIPQPLLHFIADIPKTTFPAQPIPGTMRFFMIPVLQSYGITSF